MVYVVRNINITYKLRSKTKWHEYIIFNKELTKTTRINLI